MKKMDKTKTIFMGIGLIIVVVAIFVYLNFFRTFTVEFDVRIGAGIATKEIRIGDTVEKPEDPTADGYTFLGWYVDDEEYDFTTPVKGNLVITAKWEENK